MIQSVGAVQSNNASVWSPWTPTVPSPPPQVETRGDDVILTSAILQPAATEQEPANAPVSAASLGKGVILGMVGLAGVRATMTGCAPPPERPLSHSQTVAPSREQAAPVQQKAPQTELEVRQRELELKERELALKEKEMRLDEQREQQEKRIRDMRESRMKRDQMRRDFEAGQAVGGSLRDGINSILR